MAVKTINMIMALSASDKDIQSWLKKIVAAINHMGKVNVAKIAAVYKKEDIDAVVRQNTYDVIVMNEKVGTDSIGGGSIKKWRQDNPRIKLIMVVPNDKKGGMKLSNLYHEEYYSAILLADFTAEMLVKLILNDRTREEARKYYGLPEEEPVVDTEGKEVSEDSVQTDNSPLHIDEPVEADKTEPPKTAVPPDGELGAEEVSDDIKDIIGFDNNTNKKDIGSQEEQHFMETPVESQPVRQKEYDPGEDLAYPETPAEPVIMPERRNETAYAEELYREELIRRAESARIDQSHADRERKAEAAYEQDRTREVRRPAQADDYRKEREMPRYENPMDIEFRGPRRGVSNNERRMPQEEVRHLPNEYYGEDDKDFLDDEFGTAPAPTKREMPYEPTFGGGKKELPAQFKPVVVDPTVASYGGYVIKPISDTVLLIEVPDAHFLNDVHVQEGELINLITSRL